MISEYFRVSCFISNKHLCFIKNLSIEIFFFTGNHLRGILYNFNNGGVDTGNSTLEFALLYMATWPDIQKKVQEELDRVIGRDRRPAYGERKM